MRSRLLNRSILKFCKQCDSLTERPFSRVHKYSKVLKGKAVGTVVLVDEVVWFKREWSMELDLTFDREVMEKLQRL